jgi:RNA polymerase sigma-70 factor (ECF subfamily)
VQETFLAALHGRGRFQQQAAFQTWLTGILKHKIIDHLRKTGRETPRQDLEALIDAAGNDFKDNGKWQIKPAQWKLSPLKVYENKEFLDVLYRCLADLPQRIADAFIMREMEGRDTAEICKLLDITTTNTLVRLYRARVYLRRCLETKWFEIQA